MKLKKLLEEFKDYVKQSFTKRKVKHFPVFVNPTKKEMQEVAHKEYKHLRFIIDKKNKKFYVFTADALHYVVIEELKLDRSNIMRGEGKFSITPVEHHVILFMEHPWVEKYLKYIRGSFVK